MNLVKKTVCRYTSYPVGSEYRNIPDCTPPAFYLHGFVTLTMAVEWMESWLKPRLFDSTFTNNQKHDWTYRLLHNCVKRKCTTEGKCHTDAGLKDILSQRALHCPAWASDLTVSLTNGPGANHKWMVSTYWVLKLFKLRYKTAHIHYSSIWRQNVRY